MVRSIPRALASLALMGCVPVAVWAQDLPKRKAGLWEMSMEVASRPGAPMKSLHCADEKSDALAQKKVMDDQADSRCQHQVTRRAADAVEVQYTCSSARGKSSGSMKLSGSMESRYTLDNHVRFDPPRHGMDEARVKTQGQWLGACPADMKPGDIRMAGMPEGSRPRRAERGASGVRTMTPEQMQQMQQMMEQMKKQRGG